MTFQQYQIDQIFFLIYKKFDVSPMNEKPYVILYWVLLV